MPLNGENAVFPLHRFDDAVGGDGGHEQIAAQHFDGLMVKAIDLHFFLFYKVKEAAIRCNAKAMAQVAKISLLEMGDGSGSFFLNVLV